MKKILLLGAGLSTINLIKYLLDNSEQYDWTLRIGDQSLDLAKKKIGTHPRCTYFNFDVTNQDQLFKEISQSDIVISMLPVRFHHHVAAVSVELGKNMVTASYVSDEIKAMNEAAKQKGIIILMEIGVDPGIDHMSAMKIIDEIKMRGGKINLFKSFTGGLIAPKHDNNPWNYKFTWNPRNVVLAGQGVSKFIRNGKYKYIPYNRVFTRTERVFFDEVGEFEAYANRDSLKYREIYGLKNIPTMFRGTLRRPGFCKSWNIFVQLGMTDDSYQLEEMDKMSYRDFTNSFFSYNRTMSLEEKMARLFNLSEDSSILYKMRWLGLFSDEKIGLKRATPAQVLLHLLKKKWALDDNDKDMIVMKHLFEYSINDKREQIESSLVVYGNDHTAMSITVGTPLAIAVKHILLGNFTCTGVQIPIKKEIYEPILEELKEYGIRFNEKKIEEKDFKELHSTL